MGAPVVHGMHLVVWALDRWLESFPSEPAHIVALRAAFRTPLYLGREITLEARAGDHGATRLVACCGGMALDLSIRIAPTAVDRAVTNRAWPDRVAPAELSREAAAVARGAIELAIDPARSRTLFPAATDRLGPPALAELLATTRLVGMACPGLHSLYAGLALDRHSGAAGAALAYETVAAQLKYSRLVLGVSGPSLAGTLDVFYRPAPTRIAMADAIRAVEPASFAGQRALVIGGSRGLGEAISKVIAAGAGEVCLTYHRGAADAERIVGEIRDAGQRAVAIGLDVFDPAPLRDRWPFSAPPTHLYYLATPTLFSIRKGAAFAVDELELMIKYYVSGLHATTAAAVALGAERLVVWTPSTSMLDAPSGGVAYCAAKAAMEELCKHLPALLPVTVHAPRLGRVDTDQTAGLIAQPPVSAIEIALEQVRRVAR